MNFISSIETFGLFARGEALEPLGFKKLKGKYPYFVRLVGDEIVHVVTYMDAFATTPGYKAFHVLGGVATVYRKHITLDESPSYNRDWLSDILRHYIRLNPFEFDRKYRRSLDRFEYNNETIMFDLVSQTLVKAEKHIIPALNKVVDFTSCIEYFNNFGPYLVLNDDSEDFGNKHTSYYLYNEGLLLIKNNDRKSFIELGEKALKHDLAVWTHQFKEGRTGFKQEGFEAFCERLKRGWPKRIKRYDDIINNPKIYAKALAELEQRRVANTEILRTYGFDL